MISYEPGNAPPTAKNDPDTEHAQFVSVCFYGSIRAAVRRSIDYVEIDPGCVFSEILRSLSRSYGDKFKYEVFREDGDSLRDDLIVTIDDVIIEHSRLEDLRLFDGDAVSLFPNFSGGG